MVHAAAVLVAFRDVALRKACRHMDDGILAVVEPYAAELEIGPIALLQPEHVAIEPLDRGQIALRAADVEMQETSEFHDSLLQGPGGGGAGRRQRIDRGILRLYLNGGKTRR